MINNYKYSETELQNLINNYSDYFAHLSADEKTKETLLEHLLLVQKYFFKLIVVHHLEDTIDKLSGGISNEESIKGFVLELFVKSIVIHDFGKVNPKFQSKKMKNPIKGFSHNLSSGHSLISGYIFSFIAESIAKTYNFKENQETLIDYLCLSFSYPILKHHSSTLESIKDVLSYSTNINDLKNFAKVFNGLDHDTFFNEINEFVFNNASLILNKGCNSINDKFALFALLKLNYSLLTAADYLATSHFMNNWGDELITDFGVFNNNLKKKIIHNIESTTSYNRKTYSELDNYNLEFPTQKSNANLNKLRQNLSVEIITGIRKNIQKNLFYIEAPTGGGKTNLSMLALAELLRNDINTGQNNITKVFYVFPFTTLITQTFKSLKETLGLNYNEIVQIHSKAGFSQKGEDDTYGNKKLNIIDYQFVNYPFALLSHIKFFDIIKSNRKSANYLMHRLANSVVIIDELQAYSPDEWDKVIYFINKYSEYFNIKFILMSATLPKIHKLLSDDVNREFEKKEFVYLNQNKERYFQNPNFAERIEFDFSMINAPSFDKENKKDFLINIWNKLVLESENYKEYSDTNKVHTIIEFIFKSSASDFFEIAYKNNKIFDDIFILSGTTLEPRRKEIIAKLKSPEYSKMSILLITTQVVEAGVDIDMDLGFKDTSLLDSDEQLAGRINRNVNKSRCKLYLFDYDDASVIYGKDIRYKELREQLNKNVYREILKTKDFDKLYNQVMKYIKYHNEQRAYSDTLPAYLNFIKNLNFNSINKEFQLISNSIQTTSIYVPVNIDVRIPNNNEPNFSDIEIDFLRKKGKYNDNEVVNGECVWELYCDIIENRDTDFTIQKEQNIIMQGLISKFSFSIGTYSKSMKRIESSGYGEMKYGFYKITETSKVYDYNTGLKTIEFEDIIFL